jgi:hypothetical protein
VGREWQIALWTGGGIVSSTGTTATACEWSQLPMNYRKALNLAYGVSADNKSAVGDWAKSLTGYKDWDSPWCEAKQSIQRGGQQYIRPLREIREEMDEASKVQFDSHVAKKVKEIKETYEEINIADIAMDIRKTYGFSELPDGAIGLAAMQYV